MPHGQVFFIFTHTSIPMKNLILFASFVLLAFITACKKDPVGPAIYVEPSTLQITSLPLGLTEFRIKVSEGDNPGLNVQVLSKPENSITSTLLDTSLFGSQADFFYAYRAPDSGAEDVILTFRVFDNDGLSNSVLRRVLISGNSLLSQTTGHLIYSGYNTSSINGFNIATASPYNLATLTDSSSIDLMEFDLEDDDVLSRSLSSYSGIKFIRNNDFNYAQATNQSAKASFESSTPQSIISNINNDDILIAKYDTLNNRFAVIRIIDVTDESGINSDRYEFNLKK